MIPARHGGLRGEFAICDDPLANSGLRVDKSYVAAGPGIGTRVALRRPFPKDSLVAGEVGRVVLAYPNGIAEVEFLDGAGARKALITCRPEDIAPA